MKKRIISLLLVAAMVLAMAGCGSKDEGKSDSKSEEKKTEDTQEAANAKALADQDFDTSYEPKKDEYKIYCTYKLVHAWYDAIEVGVKAAVADFKDRGVTIDYEWYAPVEPDAVDQVNSIETAVGQGYDLVAVDVNQIETTQPAVDDAVDAGVKVALFASSDIPDSERSFFVGNNDNYGDGAAIAEAVCEKMGKKGKIAFLSGTIGASSHEQRLEAFYDTVEKYPDIEVVDDQRDNDFVEKAIEITEAWMQAYPDLNGILCNNMSNPVGACQAVKDAGKSGEVIIGGMDHDLRTFNYLKDGTLYVAQVQNCYDMGYKLIYNAVKCIDGEDVDEITDVGSTSVYQDQADEYIDMLFGDAK
ncbi:substrate-binding domain-containing protein [Extibacter muris]|uniref:substrate-binding domain-containing protein n=1 Tax=Extibacter muris TaxID=1796622 RepID=UPI001D075913|nr:substrate-binding domain-containing protein [Extibacter muris]BDF35333.1 hypothetical protein CE91St61_34080 [Lachnospiraceae bacterium]MCB6202065.1 substrate-binding domain-containing protein [Extibacter muris]MCQ4665690.1 substrate-binding domain-containing protein [Extibacter muris]MCQ4693134.1 substrate-binding domain-containing protein [Extibacter muris]BDF39335.1 hypothetical protein CE91St62_33960 [Lachnospiraceae bacterium]